MRIAVVNAGLLPASARRVPLFTAACRSALGPAARKKGELNVIFLRKGPMRRINREYLGHDYDTDVLAFPYARGNGADAAFGDVFVSVDQAKAQARELGHSLLIEALTLAVHGTLHLVGYRDGRPAQRRRMLARQDLLVRRALGG